MALGDGIGRNKGVKHWSFSRKRDYKLNKIPLHCFL